MPDARPPIPLLIQREIRQRCGFGCVVCGLPLYEYEHMLGYANVERHVASEITLLCDQHHKERTNGLLPLDVVQQADKSPFNLREGVSKPYSLHFAGGQCEAVVGSNRFTTQDAGYGTVMIPISVDGIPLLGFILGDGHLLLNVRLYDRFNNLILRIDNNALTYRPVAWDIQFVGRNLILREAQRQILLDILFEPPNRIVINRGHLLCNGVAIDISPHGISLNGRGRISRCSAENCPGGLIIGPHDPPLGGFLGLPHVSRYPEGQPSIATDP